MAISFLKKTNREAIAKVAGNSGSHTIALADLLVSGEIYTGEPLTVDILGVTWTGHYDTTLTVSRNNEILMTLPSTGSNYVNLSGENMFKDVTNNTSDIVVNITGSQGEVWLRLRKRLGYDFADPFDNTRWDNGLLWDSGLIWE